MHDRWERMLGGDLVLELSWKHWGLAIYPTVVFIMIE
jgi:hypothetical protein